MSVRDGLIVALPDSGSEPPRWMRVAGGAVVQSGTGTGWLSACGLPALPDGIVTMLVTPGAHTVLHWIDRPDLPARQGRAVARLDALRDVMVPAGQLQVATDANDDPAESHLVGVTARTDLVHWLLWAQHHGLDPDIILPAPLLLPPPAEGFVRGTVAGVSLLRGQAIALPDDLAVPALVGEGAVRDATPDEIESGALAALADPPLNLRQGDYAKRRARALDRAVLMRILLWAGLILLVGLLVSLTAILKQNLAASRLDAKSLALARQVLPAANDPVAAQAELARLLAARGAGGQAFLAPAAALLTAMQDVPGVALTTLTRDPAGVVGATLASARAEDINLVLLALQAAGYTITATSAQDPGGRVLAQVTVRS
ncbi:MAG: type II secretion system protein GspL [Sphingobium sp.]